ncbi:hypothetical protein [Uliginosibacterium gangwonense]|uniref:hypothetical protein n=1 Tax=Uliginosibacterium gangwonense TaxID=392736 RepID=UPI000376D857|nr:hypothetical protein [Uliginosibacterium gangwonense]
MSTVIDAGLNAILGNLNAARLELARYEATQAQRDADRILARRQKWHQHDLLGSDQGIFFEAVTETLAANQAEFYVLMLIDPAQFGVRLASMVSDYADDVARHQLGL